MPDDARPASYLMPSLEHTSVGHAMHPGILSCEPDTAIEEVARMMTAHQVHCIVVTHSPHGDSRESYVWGIISDVDLIEATVEAPGTQTAGALAHQPTISVRATVPLQDAARLMLSHRASHLVVTDPESLRPIGVLSTLDVVGAMARGEGAT